MIAVVGPTAVGKTALAVALALSLDGELVNADSRQVIRGLRVGTSAPTTEELEGVPCHLLGARDPGEEYTVAEWVVAARASVDSMSARGRVPIVVGGTGLYISALVDGFDASGGPPDPEVRDRRTRQAATQEGLRRLVAELLERDPEAVIDERNPRRVIRALEILDAGAASLSSARRRPGARPAVMVGLDAEPALHRELVRRRVETMFDGDALLDEVRSAIARGVSRADLASSGIGYAEALSLLDGALTRAGAIDATVARTLRYAKAQRTWFRRDARIRWFTRGGVEGEEAGLIAAVRAHLETLVAAPSASG